MTSREPWLERSAWTRPSASTSSVTTNTPRPPLPTRTLRPRPLSVSAGLDPREPTPPPSSSPIPSSRTRKPSGRSSPTLPKFKKPALFYLNYIFLFCSQNSSDLTFYKLLFMFEWDEMQNKIWLFLFAGVLDQSFSTGGLWPTGGLWSSCWWAAKLFSFCLKS